MPLVLREHPDLRSGEAYFMDCDPSAWGRILWSTRRRGPDHGDGTFPVFVERWELDQVGFNIVRPTVHAQRRAA